MTTSRPRLWKILGPGVLVAATGVGAGDLATGALAGSKLGVAVLWAIVLGAGMKFVLNEGLARWQLATGTTLLEGATTHLGRVVQWVFGLYLVVWSFLVAAALMSACGVTAHAIFALGDARGDKILYGLVHSAVAVVLVKLGGYKLFGRVMGVCIAVMFAVVVVTAVRLGPGWADVGLGLVRPAISRSSDEALAWTVALMGGVGGTVTVLCYGYWIREEGRLGAEDLRTCRVDLAVGYAMTALFGIAMVIVGSSIEVHGSGATLVVDLAERLEDVLGPAARWGFLVGAWGAVFSSLLGVWQSVPYLFADFWRLAARGNQTPGEPVNTRSLPYQAYLYAIAAVPALGLVVPFQQAQKFYAVFGAMFIPMLALALLVLNGRSRWVGPRQRNRLLTNLVLAGCLAFFLYFLWLKVEAMLPR